MEISCRKGRIEEAEIKADFSQIPPYEIDGSRYPTRTIMASAFLPDEEELTLEQIAERREQELEYAITRQLINHYYRDEDGNRYFHKFKRLKNIEITGFNKDKEHKVNYVYNRWLPAVNNVREKYGYDEWHFIEIANDIRDIKNELRDKINSIQTAPAKKEA